MLRAATDGAKNYLWQLVLWQGLVAPLRVLRQVRRATATREPAVDESPAPPFRPPYMSFQTFWKFIEDLSARPLPPQIDRSIMNSKSGTDQANLMSALTGFGLIGADQRVEPGLRDLAVSDEATRRERLAALIRKHYPEQVAVAEQNGTEQQLHQTFRESFSLESADTRRKAVTFYLHAARTAGMTLSEYFPATRSGSGSPGTSRPKRPAKRRASAAPTNAASNGAAARQREGQPHIGGDTYTVDLASGGTVSVAVSVNLFDLTTEDRSFVIDLIDKLKGYPQVAVET